MTTVLYLIRRPWIYSTNAVFSIYRIFNEYFSNRDIIKQYRRRVQEGLGHTAPYWNHLMSNKKCKQTISAIRSMLLVLYFVTNGFQPTASLAFGIRQPTFLEMLAQVLIGALKYKWELIYFPTTAAHWIHVKQTFNNVADTPNCLRAMDWTHIVLCPPWEKEIYHNWKHYHFFNVQSVCVADMQIMSVNSGSPGRCRGSII